MTACSATGSDPVEPYPLPTEWSVGRIEGSDPEYFVLRFDTPGGTSVYYFQRAGLQEFMAGLQQVVTGLVVPRSPEVIEHVDRAERRRRMKGDGA